MSFVILGFIPILALGSIAEFGTIKTRAERLKKSLLEAGKVRLILFYQIFAHYSLHKLLHVGCGQVVDQLFRSQLDCNKCTVNPLNM